MQPRQASVIYTDTTTLVAVITQRPGSIMNRANRDNRDYNNPLPYSPASGFPYQDFLLDEHLGRQNSHSRNPHRNNQSFGSNPSRPVNNQVLVLFQLMEMGSSGRLRVHIEEDNTIDLGDAMSSLYEEIERAQNVYRAS
jgi:hypothetical protein